MKTLALLSILTLVTTVFSPVAVFAKDSTVVLVS